jgi:hypothetical protein
MSTIKEIHEMKGVVAFHYYDLRFRDCSYPGHCCDLDENWTFCEGLYCTIHPKVFAKVDDYLYASPGTVNHNNGRLLPLSFHEFLL